MRGASVGNSTATVTSAEWQAVADELAGALRATMLRNPSLTARDWNLAKAALERYESAGGEEPAVVTADLSEQPAG
jgi:hypothetical protein